MGVGGREGGVVSLWLRFCKLVLQMGYGRTLLCGQTCLVLFGMSSFVA